MIQVYLDGRDIHDEMEKLSRLIDYMPRSTDESRRRVAKIENFMIQYEPNDNTAVAILLRTCAQAEVYLTREEAYQIVQAKRKATMGLTTYYDKIKYEMQTRGYVETEYGRRLVMPWLSGRGRAIEYANIESWKNAINMPIQGTSADMIKLAISKLYSTFKDLPYRVRLIWTVHDSILLDVPDGKEQEVIDIAKPLMEGVFKLRVPIVVDTKIGKNLAEMH
jgi:DNA polymerase-1